jgi:hypothetical protein
MRDNYTINPASSSPRAVNCPALVELAAHLAEAESEIATHLETCRRCRALLPSLAAVAAAPPETVPRTFRAAVPARRTAPAGALQIGELVTAESKRAEGALLVALVIAVSDDQRLARVAPITTDLSNLASNDLRLAAADTPLTYDATAELWNLGWVAAEAIAERFGLASERVVRQLRNMLEANGDVLPRVGIDDARFLFQELERESAGQFFVSVPAETFANRFREAAAATAGFVSDLVANGWSTDALEDLQRDVVDPRRVAPQHVAKLFELAGWVADVGAVCDEQVVDALRRSIGNANVFQAPKPGRYARFLHFAQRSRAPRLLDRDAFVNEVLRLLTRGPQLHSD